MTIYQVDIEKRLGSEFWSNRYILNMPTFAEAVDTGLNLVTVERAFHASSVVFTRYRVSTAAVDDGVYNIVPLGTTGLRGGSTALLPLFNTLRFDMPAVIGRPSRKFYRGVLREGDIDGEGINVSFFQGNADALAIYLGSEVEPGIVDPQGSVLLDVVVHPFVQMRQLRRSRRRRTNGDGIFQ